MNNPKESAVELVLARLLESEALLERFLDAPAAVAAELIGTPADQATLEAIGDRLRVRFAVEDGKELTSEDLDKVSGGFARMTSSRFRPMMGSTLSFTGTISVAS